MAAPDRREYEKLFGREDMRYEEIYKIEYRNKAIYEDANFCKINNEISEELVV